MSLYDMLDGSSSSPYQVNGQDWQTTQQMIAQQIAQLAARHGLRMPPGTGLPTHPQQQAPSNMGAGLGAIMGLFAHPDSGQMVQNSPMLGGASYLGQDVGQPWMQGLQGYGTF